MISALWGVWVGKLLSYLHSLATHPITTNSQEANLYPSLSLLFLEQISDRQDPLAQCLTNVVEIVLMLQEGSRSKAGHCR